MNEVAALARMQVLICPDTANAPDLPTVCACSGTAISNGFTKRAAAISPQHMTVFYLLRERGDGWRVGFTVGKVLGGAVERNRIKRRLREAVRLQWPGVCIPADVVVNPKKTVLKIEFADLENEIASAFAVIQKSLGRRTT